MLPLAIWLALGIDAVLVALHLGTQSRSRPSRLGRAFSTSVTKPICRHGGRALTQVLAEETGELIVGTFILAGAYRFAIPPSRAAVDDTVPAADG